MAQIDPDSRAGARARCAAIPRPSVGKFDGKPGAEPTELDALDRLPADPRPMVDFATFDAAGPNLR